MSRIALAVLTAIMMIVPLATTAHAQVGNDPTIEQQDLATGLLTPTAMAVADDGRVIVTSREGQVTVWEQNGETTRAAKLSVDAYDRSGGQYDEQRRCDEQGAECPDGYNLAEGGIHGILLAPDFLESGELYMYYTVTDSLGMEIWPPKHPDARPWCAPITSPNCRQSNPETQPNHSEGDLSDEGKFRLSRFTLDLDTNILDVDSEVPLFENPAEWFLCCHYGGDLEWKNDGTLLMSVGDDTSSDHSNQYSPHDRRSDHTWNSAELTSQNKADRRGKILRIDVDEIEAGHEAGLSLAETWDDPAYDGIPGGDLQPNPFSDDPGADPWVYALGFRSNYRFAYNPASDHLYVGTVGPDAQAANPTRGPAAHDEIEVVPPGGGTNHGWPYCIANNLAYNEHDFETGLSGEPFDCSGMTPAAIWYTYRPSDSSPYVQMGGGSNTVMGGEAYFRPDSGALRLPARYDSSLLWMEHGRGQMLRSPINADGSLDNSPASLEIVLGSSIPFTLPVVGTGLRNPIDSQIGPDGALYILEGNGFWNSTNGILSRLVCAGCTPDAADYGDDVEVAIPGADVAVASIDGGVAQSIPVGVAVAIVLALAAGVGIRRRREVL